MTYTESIKFLYGLQKFGMKFGLEGIRSLLDHLDRPETRFRSIHIAGTNGKGSTASMIAAIFTAAGYKTGLFTSPHILKFNERIRINGIPVSSHVIAVLATSIKSEVIKNKCTFFEAATAIAFKYFSDSEVDIAVIECGLGGRLDSTNVLRPEVSVITSVGMEHAEILGGSIEKIAMEKCGIIKKGIPCVSAVTQRHVVRILRSICRTNQSEFVRIRSKDICIHKSSLKGLTVDLGPYKKVGISLTGEHQAMNAYMAIKTVKIAARRFGADIKESEIRLGLKNIEGYSGIYGRLSVISCTPLIIADVAHNSDAIKTLCRSLLKLNIKKFHVVFGLMKDKDYKRIIYLLRQITKSASIVSAQTERSRPNEDLFREFQRYGILTYEFPTVRDGVASALRYGDNIPVLITGSHFVVGEALAFLKKEKYLTINQ